ncbi:uncharacterized protein [Macaca fascicularis]|uniref:uncharacterized protein n=1 Tax=Macaca fascicularis TaxID=9541 RepID=UPI003D15CBE1
MAGPPRTLRRQPREASGSRGEAWSRLARPCGVSPLRGTAGAVGAQFSHLRPSSGAAGWRGAPGDPQAIGAPPRPGLQPRLPGTRRPSRPRPHLFRGSFLPVPPPRSPRHRAPPRAPPSAPSPIAANARPAARPPPRGSIPASPGPLCSAREGSHPQPLFARGPRASQPAKQRRWRQRQEKARRRRRRGRYSASRPAHGSLGPRVPPPIPGPEACWRWTTSPGRPRERGGAHMRPARLSGTPSPTAHSGPGSLLALHYKSRQAAREGRGSHARREALWDPEFGSRKAWTASPSRARGGAGGARGRCRVASSVPRPRWPSASAGACRASSPT